MSSRQSRCGTRNTRSSGGEFSTGRELKMPELSNRVGEIIEASTAEFTAQCYELYESPPLGGLVKTGDDDEAQYGIVYNVTTSGIEPGRRPIARGKDEASEAAIYRSSPQLAKLLPPGHSWWRRARN